MIGARLSLNRVSWCRINTSHSNTSLHLSIKLCFPPKNPALLLLNRNVSCKCSQERFSHRSNHNSGSHDDDDDDDDDDYVEAMVLFPETVRHFRMLMRGFQEETLWNLPHQLVPFSIQGRDPRADVSLVGPGFLQRFQSPTIFLKVSCEGDFLLPIIVGENGVEKLIESLHEDVNGECPDQFQLARNLVDGLGYQVKMVKITERVVNTYFARIIFHKPGEQKFYSVEARPSDAINVARRCMAPIFINKHLILTDAIRIAYGGLSRTGSASSTYDVILDSASEGPDILSEDFNLVRSMNLAAKEERYHDAAMLKEKLRKLHEKHKH